MAHWQPLRRSRKNVHQNIGKCIWCRIPSTPHHESISQHKKVLQVAKIEFELRHAIQQLRSATKNHQGEEKVIGRAWLATNIHFTFHFYLTLPFTFCFYFNFHVLASTLTFTFLLPFQLSLFCCHFNIHFFASTLTFIFCFHFQFQIWL